jgi:hypothetical protein
MRQFRIEIADGDQGRFFDINPLGSGRYEIFVDGETIGKIQLDEKDHAHCESQGCELDLPVMNLIREGIQAHEQWSPKI